MRVRAAGALLLAPLFAVVSRVLDQGSSGRNQLKLLFWTGGSNVSQGTAFLRDVLFALVLVAGILGICGPRFSRWVVGLVGTVLLALHIPWIVYDATTFNPRPPSWLLRNYPWYTPSRGSAILWTVVLALAVVLALTDRDPRHVKEPAPTSGTWGEQPPQGYVPVPVAPAAAPPPPAAPAPAPPPPAAPAAYPPPPGAPGAPAPAPAPAPAAVQPDQAPWQPPPPEPLPSWVTPPAQPTQPAPPPAAPAPAPPPPNAPPAEPPTLVQPVVRPGDDDVTQIQPRIDP